MGEGCNLKLLNRCPPFVVLPFEGFENKKKTGGKKLYDHFIEKGGTSRPEI